MRSKQLPLLDHMLFLASIIVQLKRLWVLLLALLFVTCHIHSPRLGRGSQAITGCLLMPFAPGEHVTRFPSDCQRVVAVRFVPAMLPCCRNPVLTVTAIRHATRNLAEMLLLLWCSSACRLKVEHLPHIRMAVPDFRPFTGLKTMELRAWELGNLALLPCLPGLVSVPERENVDIP